MRGCSHLAQSSAVLGLLPAKHRLGSSLKALPPRRLQVPTPQSPNSSALGAAHTWLRRLVPKDPCGRAQKVSPKCSPCSHGLGLRISWHLALKIPGSPPRALGEDNQLKGGRTGTKSGSTAMLVSSSRPSPACMRSPHPLPRTPAAPQHSQLLLGECGTCSQSHPGVAQCGTASGQSLNLTLEGFPQFLFRASTRSLQRRVRRLRGQRERRETGPFSRKSTCDYELRFFPLCYFCIFIFTLLNLFFPLFLLPLCACFYFGLQGLLFF